MTDGKDSNPSQLPKPEANAQQAQPKAAATFDKNAFLQKLATIPAGLMMVVSEDGRIDPAEYKLLLKQMGLNHEEEELALQNFVTISREILRYAERHGPNRPMTVSGPQVRLAMQSLLVAGLILPDMASASATPRQATPGMEAAPETPEKKL